MFEEIVINQFLQQFSNPLVDLFFATITWLGHPIFLLIISAILFWNEKENNSLLLVMIVSISSIIVHFAKQIIARPRPQIQVIAPKGLRVIENAQGYSMPSGHSTMLGVFASFFENKVKPNQRKILYAVIILALVSRLYLGVHYFSDVIIGFLLGYLITKAMLGFEKKIEKVSFKLSKAKQEIAIILLITIFFALNFFLAQEYYTGQIVIGYLLGFFLYKQLPKRREKKAKDYAFVGIGLAMLLAIIWLGFSLSGVASQAVFFFAGFFITIVWPTLGKSLKQEQPIKKL